MPLSRQILLFSTPSDHDQILRRLVFLEQAGYVLMPQKSADFAGLTDVSPSPYILCSYSCLLDCLQHNTSVETAAAHLSSPLIVLGQTDADEGILTRDPYFLFWCLTDSDAALKSLLQCQLQLSLSRDEMLADQRRQRVRQYLLNQLTHNMNGPITPLMGLTEPPSESSLPTEKVQQLMQSAVQRLYEHMASLNLLAAFHESYQALQPTDIAIHEFLFTLQTLLQPAFQSKALSFVFEGSALQQTVRVDRLYFQRVLKNCLSAAAALALPETEVRLACHSLSPTRLQSRRNHIYGENQRFFDFFTERTARMAGIECLISIQMSTQQELHNKFSVFLKQDVRAGFSEPLMLFLLSMEFLVQCVSRHELCFYMETQVQGSFNFGFVLPLGHVSG